MKTIDTLIEDIQKLVDGDHTVSQESVEQFSKQLAEVISKRLFQKRENSNELRMSNLGTPCSRKLWYTISDEHDPTPLPIEAKIKFLFGDILEELLLFLAKESGHAVTGRQDELDIEGVKGHRDAIIDGVLVDVKSASSRSFDKFAKHGLEGDDPFGYLDQINAYHWASLQEPHDVEIDKDRLAFLVIDKQLGHICLDVYKPNGKDYGRVVQSKRAIVSSPTPPKRPYMDEPDGKSGNRKIPTTCGYCDYKHSCWTNLRTFIYSNGPRYLTHVARLPDVPERSV